MLTHNLGFPRIGRNRELKKALEAYWKGEIGPEDLERTGRELRARHWKLQAALDLVPVGDFSFYDHMLDMSFTLGNLPPRFLAGKKEGLDLYFQVARGGSSTVPGGEPLQAAEMTKWFDTNYHYLVPEFTRDTTFTLHPERLVSQIREAQALGLRPKAVVTGPLTYLALGKSSDGVDKLTLVDSLIPVYQELGETLAREGVEWVQVDEPLLCTDLDEGWAGAYRQVYAALASVPVKILLTTYFGPLGDNLPLAWDLPVAGLHLDAAAGLDEARALGQTGHQDKLLSLGVVSGRNIWKTALGTTLDGLEPLARLWGEQLALAPSCSLVHVPVDLDLEGNLDPEIRSWWAFARQKLDEVTTLARALVQGRSAVQKELEENRLALESRRLSPKVHNPEVKKRMAELSPGAGNRTSPYPIRQALQAGRLPLPPFPTTTIGSFPQTPQIRQLRGQFKAGKVTKSEYEAQIKGEIRRCVAEQERLGLDVLVHGEAERNDMVEYFGEQLEGYVFTQNGWVQSYGSRCVKPPVIVGDVSRPRPMTVGWITYAQSLTPKPMKAMVTGPVTLLNWSFVRDDQGRDLTCRQLALAMKDEVQDLERAGIKIIQIDEAALREGLPLRKSQRQAYLTWAVESFRLAANAVDDHTQIHTHMCYSQFNDIIGWIAAMDADVVTIETSRSAHRLLEALESFDYPNGLGPGVYDIHSPAIPSVESMVEVMKKALDQVPGQRLWVNPDCGLKTRRWEEVIPALANLVEAAQRLRKEV